jgi:hypothetical protein
MREGDYLIKGRVKEDVGMECEGSIREKGRGKIGRKRMGKGKGKGNGKKKGEGRTKDRMWKGRKYTMTMSPRPLCPRTKFLGSCASHRRRVPEQYVPTPPSPF